VLQPPPALGCGTFVSGDVPRSPLAGQGDVLDGVMIKHATAGTFVFCRFPDEWRLGLIEHPRLNVLACPGGHVERDESADAAAIRETEEETGLRGIRLLEFPAPGLPEGFPPTHTRLPLPWWTTEIQVPPDNHLPSGHVHIDHVWAAVAGPAIPSGRPAHPFGWYSASEVAGGLPMFEDSRVLAPMLFDVVGQLAERGSFPPHVMKTLMAGVAGAEHGDQ
jgi:8-oxo-dGTP pyrophosphatase MutT (NUDIX family)